MKQSVRFTEPRNVTYLGMVLNATTAHPTARGLCGSVGSSLEISMMSCIDLDVYVGVGKLHTSQRSLQCLQ